MIVCRSCSVQADGVINHSTQKLRQVHRGIACAKSFRQLVQACYNIEAPYSEEKASVDIAAL
jgi:hypothetical protein